MKRHTRSRDEGTYVCPSCGESIHIPVDPSGGAEQRYVVIQVEFIGPDEPPRVWAEAE